MTPRDLYVVVPCQDSEAAIGTMLTSRKVSLGIAPDFDPRRDLLRYARRDSGCFSDAETILRSRLRTHRHVMIFLDHHGSGAEHRMTAEEVESDIEDRLRRNGWEEGNSAAIVFAPELESWVWSDSTRVPGILGWKSSADDLRSALQDPKLGFWNPGEPKPHDPKGAMRWVTSHTRTQMSASLFGRLAREVSFDACQDRSFVKFRDTLRMWFPADREAPAAASPNP